MPESLHNADGDTVTLPRQEYENLLFNTAQLEYEIAWLKRQIFGRKSERFIPTDDSQLSLGVQVQAEVLQEAEKQAQKEQFSYECKKPEGKKQKAVRAPIPAHLPRKEEVIEPEVIPAGSKKIGEAVTEILEMNPGTIYVRKIVRPKYALAAEEGVVIGHLPSLPIPKGNAGPGLLAHILISKYTDHLL